jgi:hypothetical protein
VELFPENDTFELASPDTQQWLSSSMHLTGAFGPLLQQRYLSTFLNVEYQSPEIINLADLRRLLVKDTSEATALFNLGKPYHHTD